MSSSSQLPQHPLAGIAFTITSILCFTLSDVFSQKLLRRGIPGGQAILFRMVFTAISLVTYLVYSNPRALYDLDPTQRDLPPAAYEPLPASEPLSADDHFEDVHELPPDHSKLHVRRHHAQRAGWIWLRGCLSGVGICLGVATLQGLPVSEAVTIFKLTPFPTGLLCWLMLGERFGWRVALAAVVSLAAVILVVQPPLLFGSEEGEGSSTPGTMTRATGVLLATLRMICMSFEFLLTRFLAGQTNPLILTLAFANMGIFISPVYLIMEHQAVTHLDDLLGWVLIFMVSLLAMFGQLLLIMAFARVPAGKIAVLENLQIPFTVIGQCIVIGDVLNGTELVGMTVIIAAGVWIAKQRQVTGHLKATTSGENRI